MAITQFLSNPSNAAEMIALIVALFTLRNKQCGYWRYFILFLAITIVIESAGFYFRVYLKQPNTQFYNVFMLLQAIFYCFIFFNFAESKKIRLLLLCGLAVFAAFLFAEETIILLSKVPLKHKTYCWYSRIVLSVMVTLYCCTFYFQVLKNDSVLNPLKYPPFWIITGLFFYYFGSLPMFAFYEQVASIKLAGNISFYNLIIGCLCCILYGSWIIGFIWKQKQVRLSRQ